MSPLNDQSINVDVSENCNFCDPKIGDYNVYIEDCRSFEELLAESESNVIKQKIKGFSELNKRSIIKWVLEHGTNTIRTQSEFDLLFNEVDIYIKEDVLAILEENGLFIKSAKNEDRDTILHIAARHGIPEVITWLVEHGADMEARYKGYKPIHLAAKHGHLKAVIRFANLGADTESYVYDHGSVLNVAAAHGHIDIIKWLVYGNEFDINVKTWNGRTAIHNALIFQQYSTIEWLVKNKANLNDMDSTGQTAVHIAAKSGKVEVLKWLVTNGADLFVKNDARENVFHIAAGLGHLNMAKWLLSMGAELGRKIIDGFTPLHLAASNGHLNMVKFLVHIGASLTVKDRTGRSVLHVAAQTGNLDIVKFLYTHGCDINANDNYGNSVVESSAYFVDVNNWLIDKKLELEKSRIDLERILEEFEIARNLEVMHELNTLQELESLWVLENEIYIVQQLKELKRKERKIRRVPVKPSAKNMELNTKKLHLKLTLRIKK